MRLFPILFMVALASSASGQTTTCQTFGSTTRCTSDQPQSVQPVDYGAALRSGAASVRPIEPEPRYDPMPYDAPPQSAAPSAEVIGDGDVDRDFIDRIVRLVRIGECRAAVDLALSRDSAALGRRVNQLCER